MMHVSLSEFILLLGGIYVLGGLVGWLLHFIHRKRKARIRPSIVILCRICGVRYEAPENLITHCPSCNTPNEATPQSSV